MRAELRRLGSAGLDVGDVLLNVVANESADLLVMAAYGHSRIRELILGGATRTVLRQMTVPVLLSRGASGAAPCRAGSCLPLLAE